MLTTNFLETSNKIKKKPNPPIKNMAESVWHFSTKVTNSDNY